MVLVASKEVLIEECETKRFDGQITFYYKGHDHFASETKIPYLKVVTRILDVICEEVVVVGDAYKALKKLRLIARAANIVKHGRVPTVRRILADHALQYDQNRLRDLMQPLFINFVVQTFGDKLANYLQGQAQALCVAY